MALQHPNRTIGACKRLQALVHVRRLHGHDSTFSPLALPPSKACVCAKTAELLLQQGQLHQAQPQAAGFLGQVHTAAAHGGHFVPKGTVKAVIGFTD